MKKIFLTLMTVIGLFMLSGCLVDGDERHYLYLNIKPYKAGDYGLYIVNEKGLLENSNVLLSLTEDSELVTNSFNPKDGYIYFMYYPYTQKPTSMPEKGDTVLTRNPHEFFRVLNTSVDNLKVARGSSSRCGSYIQFFNMVHAEE